MRMERRNRDVREGSDLELAGHNDITWREHKEGGLKMTRGSHLDNWENGNVMNRKEKVEKEVCV